MSCIFALYVEVHCMASVFSVKWSLHVPNVEDERKNERIENREPRPRQESPPVAVVKRMLHVQQLLPHYFDRPFFAFQPDGREGRERGRGAGKEKSKGG